MPEFEEQVVQITGTVGAVHGTADGVVEESEIVIA